MLEMGEVLRTYPTTLSPYELKTATVPVVLCGGRTSLGARDGTTRNVCAHQLPATVVVAITVVLVTDVEVTTTVLGANVVVVLTVAVTVTFFLQKVRTLQSASSTGLLRDTRPSYWGAALVSWRSVFGPKIRI